MVNQVSTLVAVMKSAQKTPGTAPPTTKSKNHALTRQIIICGLSGASIVRTMQVNAVFTDDGEKQTDLDSHTDTCVISQHALIMHDYNHPVNFLGMIPRKGS